MSATPKSTATQVTSLPTSTDTIQKPEGLSIDRFRSKRSLLAGNVETLLPPLSHSKIGDTGDYVRLHHDEDRYWSGELCFVTVPPAAKQKKGDLHLIEEDLA